MVDIASGVFEGIRVSTKPIETLSGIVGVSCISLCTRS
ncbi:MAG: hypothetical protein Ct9H300mP19_15510 [Dehalococcoidia bacterium]|nr:MAG: hypothetical protein Ct9H300mP19_15510 [Dehalococcoidia bacterium]